MSIRRKWLDRLTALASAPGAAYRHRAARGRRADHHGRRARPRAQEQRVPRAVVAHGAARAGCAESALTTTLDGNCLDVTDGNAPLFSLCAPQVTDDGTTVVLRTNAETVRGLGQEFIDAGETDGRLDRRRPRRLQRDVRVQRRRQRQYAVSDRVLRRRAKAVRADPRQPHAAGVGLFERRRFACASGAATSSCTC